mgnify:CR=1 FL=1
MTTPLFTVTSGRSGSYLIHKILSLYPNVESHHEFCIEHTQKLSVLHRAGVVSEDMAALQLRETHLAGVHYSQADIFAVSDNKLSYLIKPLQVILPDSRFIHLVRDGRRVVSSYYHKLKSEAMVNKWIVWLSMSLIGSRICPYPPPIKAAYWPLPDPFREPQTYYDFIHTWNRWQRLCWYWQDCNRVIMRDLEGVPDKQRFTILPLEHLVNFKLDGFRDFPLFSLLAWLGLPWKDEAWELCQTPQNVSEPVSYPLTKEQEAQYWEICGGMHEQLGYGKEDYEVQYR